MREVEAMEDLRGCCWTLLLFLFGVLRRREGWLGVLGSRRDGGLVTAAAAEALRALQHTIKTTYEYKNIKVIKMLKCKGENVE